MVNRKQLFSLLILRRTKCYIKKSPTYNPYVPSDIYDWYFELEQGKYLFTDSYRGFNPYSGVEYIYIKDRREPIWACDYVGNVQVNSFISEKDIYGFLKKARGMHLLNCGGDLTQEYSFRDGEFDYLSKFTGNFNAILQTEEIYYRGTIVGTQVSAGYLRTK